MLARVTTLTVAGVILIAAATRAQADVIHLRSGQDVEGRVISYANLVFDVAEKGKTAKYQAAMIERIAFATNAPPSTITMANKPALKATITAYEKSTFTVLTDKEQTETIQTLFVKSITFAQPAGAGRLQPISRGEEVDITEHIVPGKVTVIFFCGNFNPAPSCKLMAAHLESLMKDDPNLVVCYIDIHEWNSPVAEKYNVTEIPLLQVYDRTAKLVGTSAGNRQPELDNFIKKAKH